MTRPRWFTSFSGSWVSDQTDAKQFIQILRSLLPAKFSPLFIIPQQRKLMGSSAQISSGVCRCGPQEQVPEEGSGRFRKVPEGFRRVPACAGAGSGGKFRKVPESSGVKWCRFRRQVPEDFGGFRCMLA